MKSSAPAPRAPRFNRFQTSISGLRYAHTVMDAHFDPYAEPARRPQQSLQAMESVPKIAIAPNSN
ncbi:MAG TPA: hypothetical protein VMV31_01150 [Terriglobales bacterium]|nr:hypothetical protein [Terriglobales bacterium]